MRPFHLFLDYLAPRRHLLSTLDPRVVIALFVALLAVVITTRTILILLPIAILAGAYLVLVVEIPSSMLTRFLIPLIPMGLVVLLASLLGRSPVPPLLLISRITAGLILVLLLGSSVTFHRLLSHARALGAPSGLIEAARAVYRGIFLLVESASAAHEATRLRLGFSSTRAAAASAGRVMGGVIGSALDRVEFTAEAMKTRCFAGRYPSPPLPPISRASFLMTSLLLLLALTVSVLGLVS